MNKFQIEEYASLPALLYGITRNNFKKHTPAEERIQYGAQKHQYALLNRPCPTGQDPTEPHADILIFFLHGGGWRNGAPWAFRFVGRFFARAGYLAGLGGYRLAPKARFPAQLEDTYNGLKAVLEATSARRVILAGQSAGAQLAALAYFNREGLSSHGLSQDLFAGLLLISGPLDFSVCTNPEIQGYLRDYLGSDSGWEAADPILFVQGDETVRVLCMHGLRDPLVDPRNSQNLVERMNQNGRGNAELYLDPALHHSDPVALFWNCSPATGKLLNWLCSLDS